MASRKTTTPASSFFPPPPMEAEESTDMLAERVQETKPFLSPEIVSSIILNGDLSKLSPQDKLAYYVHRCRNLGLDPATKPFDLLKLQGKEVLYANKACAANLRALHKISTQVLEEREWNGLIIFRVKASYPDGRSHEDEGFASLNNLSGDALGNARLKAMTKATRRTVLHLCGLGELDETEVDSIPGAQKGSAFQEAKALLIPKQPATGSDAIQITDTRGADENTSTLEVLDANNRVWYFRGKENIDIALKACGQPVSVFVDYTIENGQYVVNTARS